MTNYNKIIEHNRSVTDTSDLIEVTPLSIQDNAQFKDSVDSIFALSLIEVILIVLLVIDAVAKVVNHYSVLQMQDSGTNQRVVNGKVQKDAIVHPLFNSGFIQLNNQPVVSTATVTLDILLLFLLIVIFVVEFLLADDVSFLVLGIMLISRFYLRLPFTTALIIHHYKLRLARIQGGVVFKDKERDDFSTYKEKVLFIINQVRNQFSKVIYMNHPSSDLAWCAFVIENDYLQISNSISSSNSHPLTKQPTSDEKPKKKRRFSKTVSVPAGKNPFSPMENMRMNRVQKISDECASGDFSSLTHDPSTFETGFNFAESFLQNVYDACLVDKALNGNVLYFTLMYIKNKLDWKANIAGFNEEKYRNLSFLVMKSYRKNPYHNQIHAADIIQNLYFMIFS